MEECIACYKIKCRKCGWEPSDGEVVAIQERKLTSCPVCNWVPGTPVL